MGQKSRNADATTTELDGDNQGISTVHAQGMWFKSLDQKQVPPEKLAVVEFPGGFLNSPNGPEELQSKCLKTAVMRCYK